MSLTDEERDVLVSMQIEKSKKHLGQADDMVRLGYYDMPANRYYYASLHALHKPAHDLISIESMI